MRHLFFSFLAVLCFITVDAQLTVPNHAPVAGEMHKRYQCDSTGITPGPGGANSLWNFAMATHSSVIHSYTAAVSSNFQPATVSTESDRGYEDHFRITSTALLDYSSSFPIVSGYYINLNYNSGSVKARYPMSLNTTSTAVTSGFINAIMINPQAGTFNGTSNTLADGTGTLVLPGNTYTNVIRVVNTENISYSVQFNGTIVLKNYEWYTPGAKQPVFSIVTVTLTRPAATIRRTLVTRLLHVAPAAPADVTPENDRIVCENTPATLSASGAGTIEWYDSMAATVPLASGASYITDPQPIGVYTYYAQATDFLPSQRTAISFTVTDCTSLNETNGKPEFTLYPNPSAGLFNMTLPGGINVMQVYALDGRLISSQEARSGINVVDLTQQASGVYFIKLMNNDAVVSVKKVLVQNGNR